MPYAILQTDLTPPALDQLKQAFRSVDFLTDVDAHTLGSDAFGILVKNLTADHAASLQGALRTEGVETEIVDQRALPEMPPTKFVGRLDCLPEGLMIYDPLGRGFQLEWGHLMMIASGDVRLTEFTRVQRVRRRPRLDRYGHIQDEPEVEVSTREELKFHLLLELVLTRGVQRFSVTADRFNFIYLGERRTQSIPDNFALLVQDLIHFAPHAAVNRGAFHIREDARDWFSYPSKNAFHEEIIWLLWRIRQARARE